MKTFKTTLLAAAVVTAALTQTHAAPGDVGLSFDPGSLVNGGDVYSIAVQDDGKVLIAGFFTAVHGAMRGGIARLNADGTQDTSFLVGQTPAVYPVRCLILQSDGSSLISGYSIPAIARLNVNGSPDTSFAASVVRGLGIGLTSIALPSRPTARS